VIAAGAGRAALMLLRNPARITNRGRKLWTHGNAELLTEPLHALLCSKACPGDKIIEAVDLSQRWRAENRSVISGFQTAVEKECLRFFLRGPQQIVICPARGIDPFQLPSDWQTKYQRGEILIVSPFASSTRRPTKETADVRNRLVVDLATHITIIHASRGGQLERLATTQTGAITHNPLSTT
jgi:predicted Rossmann fold nucleotide-binding protein DprA/Smf involved in DNA uptake